MLASTQLSARYFPVNSKLQAPVVPHCLECVAPRVNEPSLVSAGRQCNVSLSVRLRQSFVSCSSVSKVQAFDSDLPQFSPRQDREYEAAKNSAAGSLSLRPHSRKELEVKLKDKGYSEGAILKALDRLKELELQSDADYAEVYTRSKWRQSRWAPSRIQQELVRKGVSRLDCQAALESVFGESTRGRMRVNMDAVEDVDDESSRVFGTEERVDHQLLGSARRQAEMTVSLPTEARRRRLSGWLLRRGHDWNTVSKILALLHL
ncbi:hypothetical protein WJX77_004520 [Trebouxia sp. C0004]